MLLKDALADYYAMCAAAHMAGWPSGRSMPGIWSYYIISEPAWKINIAGLVMALIIYCISLIFSYGCDLQQESDETL